MRFTNSLFSISYISLRPHTALLGLDDAYLSDAEAAQMWWLGCLVYICVSNTLLFLMPYLHSNLTENEQPICTSSFFHQCVLGRESVIEGKEIKPKSRQQFLKLGQTGRQPYLYLST